MEDAKTDSVNLAVNLGEGAVASREHGAGGLLPCPFCGDIEGENQPSIGTNNGIYFVWARCCDFEGPLHDTRGAAIAAWNRRAPPSELKDAERMFPMQKPNLPIPWDLAGIIYAGYSAEYGTAQSLERLAERGGFSWREVGAIYDIPRAKRVIDAAIAKRKSGIGSNEPPAK